MTLTSYLRDNLVDSELYTSDFEDIVHNSKQIGINDIIDGIVPPEITAFLYENGHADDKNEIDVLINPIVLYKRNKKRFEKNIQPIAPLWIPASLNSKGQLSTKTRDMPWLARNYLFPTPKGVSSIGYLDDFNDFLRDNPFHFDTWGANLEYAANMFKFVTGYDFDHYEHEDYTIAEETYISVRNQSLGNKEGLVKIYNDLLKQSEKELPGLYKNFISTKDTKKIPTLDNVMSSSISKHHMGQFNQQFPVTKSQREALHHFFTMEDGDILAINGPPGTGKSALAQIIMSSLWVESALRQDQPPIILGGAIDNFTAVDMAEDFSSGSMKGNVLYNRWLPDIKSYALYLASSGFRKKNRPNLQVLYPNGSSQFQQRIETPEYVQKAKAHYLNAFYHYTGILVSSVNEAAEHLHFELEELSNEMKEVLAANTRLFELEQSNGKRKNLKNEECKIYNEILQQWFKHYNLNSQEDFLSHLDTTIRYRLFKLATHYWEARWLIEMEDQKENGDKLNDSDNELINKWHRYAKITPFIVSSLFTLPNFFMTGQKEKKPIYEIIDLLVIDEAGQVMPEAAGSIFALAKKALAVGDSKQVEPLWNITTTFDLANMKTHGLFSTEQEKGEILESGLAASRGSVLEVAQNSSRYQIHPAFGGMFLTEHRRSVPEIIVYCNELAYNGWLKPKRPSLKNYPFPHVGYMNIHGVANKHSASITNKIEAEGIINWLAKQLKQIKELYPDQPLTQVIGIVTPFTQQKNLIEELLAERKLEDIKVGTIHEIQGAACRIVIFSPVHDIHTKPPYFFDKNETLLNVAVSRAQDSFLVFGDKRLFNQSSKNPSGLLAQYLFTGKGNEINIRRNT